MKKKVLIAIAVFAVTAPTLWSIFGPGRMWTNRVLDAIEENNMTKMESLLKDSRYINQKGGVFFPLNLFPEWRNETPLELAAERGNNEAVKLLLKHGALPTNERINPIGTLAEPGVYSEEIAESIKLMLKSGAKPDGDRRKSYIYSALLDIALMDCVYNNKHSVKMEKKITELYKFVERYCKDKSPIYYMDNSNAMHFASYKLNRTLIEYLIEKRRYGVNSRDDYGATPLMAAFSFEENMPAEKKDVKAVADLFIKAGANKRIKDGDGRTAANMAEEKGFADIVTGE